jgi:hypothetical protein
VSEQPGPGPAAGNRVIGRRRRDHGVAGPARQLLANVPDDFEAARDVIQGLADLIGDLAQRAAATGTSAGAGCRRSSRGRCSGNGRRAGFCASAAVSAAAATSGEAAANRSAWSVCSASSASSSGSASRASFPRIARTRPVDIAPIGISAGRSRPGRRARPAPSWR